MKKTMKKTIGKIMPLLMAFSVLIGTTSAFAVSLDENNNQEFTKNEKVASELDKNLETKVKLSFPGKQEVLPSDIVFVVDKSGASAQEDIYNNAKIFLEDVRKQAEEKGLNIKVGVVLFNRSGNIKQNLIDVVEGYDNIIRAMNSSVSMGTNMHAGLLAAKDILDKDSKVKAENKHVILISDGATYLYSKDEDYTKAYTRSFGNPTKQTNPTTGQPYAYGADRKGGIWESQSREYNTPNDFKKFEDDTNFIFSQAMTNPKKLGEYLDYYRIQENDTAKNWPQYEYEYNFGSAYLGTGRMTTPIEVNAPANIDIAFMKTDDTFQEMVKKGYNMNVYFKNAADFDGTTFLKYMTRNSNQGELNKGFEELKKSVLDKISKGSYVEDYIGSDFDFVNDIKKITLTVGDESLKPNKIKENMYGFGKLDDGTYRFILEYTKGDNEKLNLEINETIYPNKPVVLKYSEKLVNKPEKSGTYEYATNEKAILHPIDGNAMKGEAMIFPVPVVKYEYKAPVNKDTEKTTHIENNIVKTGDMTSLALFVSVLMITLLTTILIFKKKNLK